MKSFEKWSKLIFPIITMILLIYLLSLLDLKEPLTVVFSTLSLFIFSFILAWVMDPMVVFFVKKCNFKRWIGAILSAVIVTGFFALNVIIIFPTLIEQFSLLIKGFPSVANSIQDIVIFVEEFIVDKMGDNSFDFFEKVNSQLLTVLDDFVANSGNFVKSFIKFLSDVAGKIFLFFIVLIVAFYLLLDFDKIRTSFYNIVPSWMRSDVEFLSGETNRVVVGYIRGLMLESIFVFLISYVLLSVFGIDNALAFAFIIGVTNLIPYAGPFIGGLPVMLFALTVSFKLVVIVGIIIIVVQQIDSLIIKPKVFGVTTNLHPSLSIISIILFGKLYGFAGVVLAIPLAALAVVIIKFIYGKMVEKYPEKLR